jgi:hypothetical protein
MSGYEEFTVKERNLERAVNLAANGRIKPDEIVATAETFDKHVKAER